MESSNKEIKYIQVTNENTDIAYDIQKNVWREEPDKQNFIKKANNPKDDYIAYIAYYEDIPIGITGVYTEDIDASSIWLDWFCVKQEYRNRGFGEQILVDTIQYDKNLGRFLYFRVETTYWKDRPAVALFDKTTFYQETPFMNPYTTVEEINEEWQHIKDENIQDIKLKILAIDNNVLIAEWFLKQNDEEFDGIYEIKFNDNLECIYFKSWEMEG